MPQSCLKPPPHRHALVNRRLGKQHHAPPLAGVDLRDADPARRVFVAFSFAVPVELDLHPTVLVAVDFFASRTGDHGGPAAENLEFGMFARRAVEDIPRRGGKVVAIALMEVGVATFHCGGADRLFQHLWLSALMEHFGEQPEVVPRRTRMVGEGEEVTADQIGVAGALGQLL